MKRVSVGCLCSSVWVGLAAAPLSAFCPTSPDGDGNGGADDCNNNHVPDICDVSCLALGGDCNRCLSCGTSTNCNGNRVPDECDPENVCPALAVMVVAVNGTPLASPRLSINAAPGNFLTLEFYGRCWMMGIPNGLGLDTLLAYRLTMDYASYLSGLTGTILPVAFHERTDPLHTCPLTIPCVIIPNFENAFIDSGHPEYVFEGRDSFPAVNTCRCNYSYVSTLTVDRGTPAHLCLPPPAVRQPPKYFGTLRVQVSDDATGTFDLCLDERTNSQGSILVPYFVGDPPAVPRIRPLIFECAAITIREVPDLCTTITTSAPPRNSIDARQPSNFNGTGPAGVAELFLDLDFRMGCVTDMQPSDFLVTTSAGGVAPTVIMVQVIDADTVRLVLSGRIPPNNWTKFEYTDPLGGMTSTCLGYLPADVDGNTTANPADITRLIACLNGAVCADYQTDTNRSGAANLCDILRVADLLNGAQSFDAQNGVSLGASPCN